MLPKIRFGVPAGWAAGGGEELTWSCCRIYLTSSCLINLVGERVESGRLRGRWLS